MTLREFRDILCTVKNVPVFHKTAQKSSEYIVWLEVNGGLGVEADGERAENGMRIAVDYFTKAEYSTVPTEIELLLSQHDEICIDGPVIDYEDDTGYTHYSYDVEVYGRG